MENKKSEAYQHLARIVREKRHELKMGQKELAMRVGVSRSYISKIENSYENISIDYDVVIKLMLVLKLDLEQVNNLIKKGFWGDNLWVQK